MPPRFCCKFEKRARNQVFQMALRRFHGIPNSKVLPHGNTWELCSFARFALEMASKMPNSYKVKAEVKRKKAGN
jgi:hypothetical protein